ncbi:GAF domain-containing protein [Natrialbaceae archaeon A-arb3/5]
MAHSTPRSRPLLVLYVGATEEDARDGADALESVGSEPDRTVHPTVSVERVREWTPEVDCVVFADSPSAEGGSRLLEVADACGSTPLVLYTDGLYASTATRSTDGIDGYVRRDTEDAAVHLVDEIAWVCRDDDGTDAELPEETDARADAAAFETTARIVPCRDRDRLFDRLVEGAVDALGFEYCWASTINFGELVPRATAPAVPDEELARVSLENPLSVSFRARESIRIADLESIDALEPPFDNVRSLCSVPVGDVGVLYVASELPDAFNGTDVSLLEGLCRVATATLERNWTETGIRNDRNRLQRDRHRLVSDYNDLINECNRLLDDREMLLSLITDVAEPTLRYEIENDEPLVADVNGPFATVFNADPESIVDDPVVEHAVPDGFREEASTLVEALTSGEQRRLSCRRQTVDGIREFVVTVVPAKPETDEPDAGLVVYDDVTDTSRRKRRLAATTERLETIAAIVDEEARTPLNTADGYLDLAEKTGNKEHFEMVEEAHDQLDARFDTVIDIADDGLDTEPVSIREAAQLAWLAVDTGPAKLVTEGDLVLEANRERLRELFADVLRATIEVEGGDDADAAATEADPVVVTVGSTGDGFYVAGNRPVAGTDGDDRQTDPEPDRLSETDGSEIQLDLVEQVADAHDWDVGVAADEEGTAFAFRGVDAVDSN